MTMHSRKLRYSDFKLFLQGITGILICAAILLVASYNGEYSFLFMLGFVCLLMLIINVILHYDLAGELDLFSPGVVFPAAYITIISIAIITINLGIGYSYIAKVTPNVIYYYLVGLLCYVCGNLLVFLLFSPMPKICLGKVINTWSMKKIFEWSLIISVIGSIGIFIYYSKMGIPLFGDVDRIRHSFQGRTYGMGFSFQLLQGLNFILLTYFVYRYKYVKKAHFIGWMIVPIFWISILSALTGYRWICILFIMVTLTGYNYIVKKFKINFRSVVIIIMAIIIVVSFVSLLGYQRKASRTGGIDRYLYGLEVMHISSKYRYFAPFLLSLQIPSVNFSKLLTLVPDEYNYFYGKYAIAQFPILPRIVPSVSKENISGYVTDTIFGLDYKGGSGGTALSIVGSLYIDYGLTVIVLGMILIGFFVEMSYLRTIKSPSLLKITVYSCFLWTVIKWIVSGVCVGDLVILLMALAINKLIKKHRSISSNQENYPMIAKNS